MKKYSLILALVTITSLVHANTCSVLPTVKVNNSSQICDLTTTLVGVTGSQVTDCSFNFNNCTTTSWGGGLLYCNLGTTTIGMLTKTATSWTCTLNSTGLTTLNNCINTGNKCDFGISCSGGWNVGGCTASYTCTPKPKTVPDAASTASLLALGLAAASLLRRKLA